MPIYEYQCERGHTFEALQRMSDDPLSTCTQCDSSVRRLFRPVAIHFKGSGFYNTDYRKRADGDAAEGSGKGEKADGASSSPEDRPKKSESDGGDASGGGSGGGAGEGASSGKD